VLTTNFSHLRPYDEQLFRLGVLAERYFPDDPNTALLKLRQLGEWLAQEVASRFGVELRAEETQQQLLRRLEYEGALDRDVAFKETRMESLHTFAATYAIKELGERVADPGTRVHITTVQAMARRLLLGDEEGRPTVDTYDLIVVDECHRGYLLDQGLRLHLSTRTRHV